MSPQKVTKQNSEPTSAHHHSITAKKPECLAKSL